MDPYMQNPASSKRNQRPWLWAVGGALAVGIVWWLSNANVEATPFITKVGISFFLWNFVALILLLQTGFRHS